jgi:hypothetical protein
METANPDWVTQLWDPSLPYKYDPSQKYLVIRFINGPGIISDIIDWSTNGRYCHTEALSRDGDGWIGAHAGTGVDQRPLDWAKVTRERRYALPVSDDEYDKAMTWLHAHIGVPYDYEDILGLFLHVRIGVHKHEMICSALMTLFQMQAPEWTPLNIDPDNANLVTPEVLRMSKNYIGRCIYALN